VKLLGSILLAAGFLAGSFVAVAQVAAVNWVHYGLCAAAMIAGMVFLTAARRIARESEGEKHTAGLATLRESLERLTQRVRGLEGDAGDEDQLRVHHRIDAELMEDINDFVEARESMIPKLGMQRYADIMSPFANAERLLNRAWSASADGYVDEVRSCVATARAELERAAELLASA